LSRDVFFYTQCVKSVKKEKCDVKFGLIITGGGVGLQSFIRAADEELLGSWASITSDLITFLHSKGLPVYNKLADALDAMANSPETLSEEPVIPAIESMLAIIAKAHTFLETIPQIETDFATSLVMGERTVDIPGRYSPLEAPTRPDPIVLPDLRTPADYVTTPCKHECAILK
jgi:hypothetical protein